MDSKNLMVELEFLNDAVGTVLNTLEEIKDAAEPIDAAPQVIRLKKVMKEWKFKKMDTDMLRRANAELGRRLNAVQSAAGVEAPEEDSGD